MAEYSNSLKTEQAITMVVERTRLALQLAASSARPVKIIITHQDGETTFAIRLL